MEPDLEEGEGRRQDAAVAAVADRQEQEQPPVVVHPLAPQGEVQPHPFAVPEGNEGHAPALPAIEPAAFHLPPPPDPPAVDPLVAPVAPAHDGGLGIDQPIVDDAPHVVAADDAMPAHGPQPWNLAGMVRNAVEADSPAPSTGFAGTAQLGTNLGGFGTQATPHAGASGGLGIISGAADLGSAAFALHDLYKNPTADPTQHDDSEMRQINATNETAGANLGLSTVDLGSRVASAAATFSSNVAPVVGTVAGGVGAGVSGLVAARTARRWWRARAQQNAVDQAAAGMGPGTVKDAADFHHDQLNRRRWKAGIGTAGAIAGTIGGALMLAGLGPVGLALMGLGGLAAVGLGAYKAYRHIKKKRAGTLGVDRDRHAQALHQNAATPDGQNVLRGMGITQSQAQGREGIALIKRKLKSD